LEIVDTPGIFDTKNDVKKIHMELIRSIVLTTPGFHALAFVLRRDKVTEEIQGMKDIIFNWFGEDVKKHSFVILTDTSTEEEQQAFLRDKSHPSITELVSGCGGRVVPLQNKWKSNSLGRVKDIITMVEYIVAKNGNSSYSNVTYKLSKSLAEDKELLSNSICLLIIEEISRKSLTRIQQETLKRISEYELEKYQGFIDNGDIECEMVNQIECSKGNLLIIDDDTNEAYEGSKDDKLFKTKEFADTSDESETIYVSCSEDAINLKSLDTWPLDLYMSQKDAVSGGGVENTTRRRFNNGTYSKTYPHAEDSKLSDGFNSHDVLETKVNTEKTDDEKKALTSRVSSCTII
jgi:hypothetical protein